MTSKCMSHNLLYPSWFHWATQPGGGGGVVVFLTRGFYRVTFLVDHAQPRDLAWSGYPEHGFTIRARSDPVGCLLYPYSVHFLVTPVPYFRGTVLFFWFFNLSQLTLKPGYYLIFSSSWWKLSIEEYTVWRCIWCGSKWPILNGIFTWSRSDRSGHVIQRGKKPLENLINTGNGNFTDPFLSCCSVPVL